MGAAGIWPDGVAEGVAQAWLHTGDLPDVGPDPEEVARRALAQIGLTAPELVTNPPTSGSVPIGMPVWLAVSETEQGWGPISDEFCDEGLCVSITARVVGIDWDMGDGSVVTCGRDQNITWTAGIDFLQPGNACHHYYASASSSQQDGRYQVTATTNFRVDWSGGGEVGFFDPVTDACGAAGDGPCQSAIGILVEEIQVLTGPGR